MPPDEGRSRTAREAAERALVQVVHHYGECPEFVLIGGLMPELLCSTSPTKHAGTTDIDVQVDIEIATGSVNAARLEQALINAGFAPDSKRLWRWSTQYTPLQTLIKFELLADLPDQPAGSTVSFVDCQQLGAANLRGTGYAARDVEVHRLTANISGVNQTVEIKATGLAGFLLAKTAAACASRLPRDWYDIAFVLLHNDSGGPFAAAQVVRSRFANDLDNIRFAMKDLGANFADPDAQAPEAYASQLRVDHPDLPGTVARADAVTAVNQFLDDLYGK